ncbi:hypothetical protein VCR26J2_290055 [Vibrio coralliirubri]|nr:hypothetical protein VCR26J2_290055 [Vibrio coralliirubri]
MFSNRSGEHATFSYRYVQRVKGCCHFVNRDFDLKHGLKIMTYGLATINFFICNYYNCIYFKQPKKHLKA